MEIAEIFVKIVKGEIFLVDIHPELLFVPSSFTAEITINKHG